MQYLTELEALYERMCEVIPPLFHNTINHPKTRAEVSRVVNNLIHEYDVLPDLFQAKCDEENNPIEMISTNKLQIGLTPLTEYAKLLLKSVRQ